MKRKKGNQPRYEGKERETEPEQGGTQREAQHETQPAWASEQAAQRARELSMAAREKASRTHLSVGQSNVQRIHKGNQPRGGR